MVNPILRRPSVSIPLDGLIGSFMLLVLACTTEAQTYNVLYNFSGAPTDGNRPTGSLLLSGTTLYGVTTSGGTGTAPGDQGTGLGTIYEYNLATSTENILYSFQGGNEDGEFPNGSLIEVGSNLFGMINVETYPTGTPEEVPSMLFQYNLNTNSESIVDSGFLGDSMETPVQVGAELYSESGTGVYNYNVLTGSGGGFEMGSFGGDSDGCSFVASGSILYGMTETGGSKNEGQIFEYNLATGAETSLYSFGTNKKDGETPIGHLTVSGSILYGVTVGGGHGGGTLFEYNLATNEEAVLYDFQGPAGDGYLPSGSLIESGSYLYGVTEIGGSGYGTVYQYDLATNTESVLYAFQDSEGANPSGSLTLSGSTLYGSTFNGGSNNAGVIFSLTVPEPATITSLLLLSTMVLMYRHRR